MIWMMTTNMMRHRRRRTEHEMNRCWLLDFVMIPSYCAHLATATGVFLHDWLVDGKHVRLRNPDGWEIWTDHEIICRFKGPWLVHGKIIKYSVVTSRLEDKESTNLANLGSKVTRPAQMFRTIDATRHIINPSPVETIVFIQNSLISPTMFQRYRSRGS